MAWAHCRMIFAGSLAMAAGSCMLIASADAFTPLTMSRQPAFQTGVDRATRFTPFWPECAMAAILFCGAS